MIKITILNIFSTNTLTACTNYCHLIAPPGLGAATQGLLSALHWGAGSALGSLVAGFVYDAFGPRILFRRYVVIYFY
jgi:hypothetical protein